MRSNRRDFLRLAGATALVAACAPGPLAVPPSTPTRTPKPVRPLKVGHLARQLGNLVPQYDEVGPRHGVKFEVSLFPDGASLLAALSTGIDSPRDVISNVLQPTYEGLGFESRAALKRAAKNSWDLPENAVLIVDEGDADDVPEGSVLYRMSPDGQLAPAAVAS